MCDALLALKKTLYIFPCTTSCAYYGIYTHPIVWVISHYVNKRIMWLIDFHDDRYSATKDNVIFEFQLKGLICVLHD